jgi:hypothetical protein
VNPLDQLLSSGYGPQIGYAPQIGNMPNMVTPGIPSGVSDNPGTIRRLVAGIPITSLATLITSDIQCNVSEPFRPDRLMLSTAAQALHVTRIQIGTKGMNVSSNPISGNCFSEQAINNDLSGYTATPGVGILLTVQNTTAATVVASGGFFGWSLV